MCWRTTCLFNSEIVSKQYHVFCGLLLTRQLLFNCGNNCWIEWSCFVWQECVLPAKLTGCVLIWASGLAQALLWGREAPSHSRYHRSSRTHLHVHDHEQWKHVSGDDVGSTQNQQLIPWQLFCLCTHISLKQKLCKEICFENTACSERFPCEFNSQQLARFWKITWRPLVRHELAPS